MQPMEILVPSLTPPLGADFWTSIREGGRPIFSARETATVFFGHNKLWLYRQIYEGRHFLDGEEIELPRGNPPHNRFRLQLGHIERLSHAFFQNNAIDVKILENSLLIVKCVASNYGLI